MPEWLSAVLIAYVLIALAVFAVALLIRSSGPWRIHRRCSRVALLSWAWPALLAAVIARAAHDLWEDAEWGRA